MRTPRQPPSASWSMMESTLARLAASFSLSAHLSSAVYISISSTVRLSSSVSARAFPPSHKFITIIITITHCSCRRQGMSCRQEGIPCWTCQIQARPNQTWHGAQYLYRPPPIGATIIYYISNGLVSCMLRHQHSSPAEETRSVLSNRYKCYNCALVMFSLPLRRTAQPVSVSL